jgi:hypothetical protein
LTQSCSYAYHLGLPILVWASLKYWAGVDERSPVEVISLYGYASTVWILVAVRLTFSSSRALPLTSSRTH